MWSFLLGQSKRVKVEPRLAGHTREDLEVQTKTPETAGGLEGVGGRREGGSVAISHEEKLDNNLDPNGQRLDGEQKSGPRSDGPSSMPEIVVLRPPVPFSSGPYPEALPSDLGGNQKKIGEEDKDTSARGTTASDQEGRRGREDEGEGATGGTREERRSARSGSGGERSGGWSDVWSSFRTAITGGRR